MQNDLPTTGFMRVSAILAPRGPVPFSKSTLYQKIKEGSFPSAVKLSARISAFRVEDIREYLADPERWEANHA